MVIIYKCSINRELRGALSTWLYYCLEFGNRSLHGGGVERALV